MSFIIFWFVSILGSYFMNFKMAFMMIKDLADAGYMLNRDNLKKFSDEFNANNTNNKLIFLIPLLNLFYSFKMSIDYVNVRWNILDQLRVLDVLEDMTSDEKKRYEENPTALNALIMLAEKNTTTVNNEQNSEKDIQKEIEKEIEKDFDDLLKKISEKTGIDYQYLKENIKHKKIEQQNDKLDHINAEKEYLNNYKQNIINSINKQEDVKVLKKTKK